MAFDYKPRRTKAGILYRMGRFISRLIIWFLAISLGMTIAYKFVPPPITVTMLVDANGFTKDWTPLSRIDRNMVAAAIGAEDSKFCTHNGFDSEAIEQAMERNAKGERLRGGSTISQQTAKNVFLWQGSGWDRWMRKGLEVWFTFLIETIWDKRRIMEVYLNVAETGIGTYGAQAGAQRYFNKSAAKLAPSEAARMAAALPSPKTRPVKNPAGFTRRYANTIAARMRIVRRDGLDACVYE